jgi:transcriptional antiterminator RfaH
MLRWYLVHTKPLGESIACSNLERQGYETYLPQLLETVRQRQRRFERVTALFPRYLFLRLDEGEQSLKPVHSTLGVTSVVRFGSRYANVPDEVIGHLRGREDPGSGLHRLREPERLKPGAPVTLTGGAFAGFEAIFEREVGSERASVLLGILGHQTRVQVSTELIAAARAA